MLAPGVPMIDCPACRALLVGLIASCSIDAASARTASRLPSFDIGRSCAAAKQFGTDFGDSEKNYRSCLADETNARRQLAKRWSSYSASQRTQCLEPGPDPSYVETLTCLQMDKSDGPGSDVGGPVAPGVDFK